jgi:hypothetical protein
MDPNDKLEKFLKERIAYAMKHTPDNAFQRGYIGCLMDIGKAFDFILPYAEMERLTAWVHEKDGWKPDDWRGISGEILKHIENGTGTPTRRGKYG